MTLEQLIARVRSMTRDFSGAAFREHDIRDYINEGIDRSAQIVPHFEGMFQLLSKNQVPRLMPERYHHLLSVYAASRCYAQDERHYQAGNLMNEYEAKMDDLKAKIEGGEVVIIDPDTGKPIIITSEPDYVTNLYFDSRYKED